MTELHPETLAISAGRPPRTEGAPLNVPITPAAALRGFGYARDGSPGWTPLEDAIGTLEGGTAVAFASGMGACMAAINLFPAGATVVAPTVLYMGVREALVERGFDARWVDIADTDAVIAACEGADALWIESPTNPLLDVADVPALCAMARERGLFCVVDNTLCTPLLQRPLPDGADVVVHSATKLIGGHSDLLLGIAVAREPDVAERLVHQRHLQGATPGALEVWLALRGLRTLPLRLERMQASALDLAGRLDGHPEIIEVRYPGLPGDPAHAVAAATLAGFGSMLTIRVRGGGERADAFIDALGLFTGATSFGSVESTLERRARYPTEQGVPEDLLRVSIGCEHPDDLWADLVAALDATAA